MIFLLLFAPYLTHVAAQQSVTDPVPGECASSAQTGLPWWNPLTEPAQQDLCSTTRDIVSSSCPSGVSTQGPECICYHQVYYMFAACKACQSTSETEAEAQPYPTFATWAGSCSPPATSPEFNDTGVIPPAFIPAWVTTAVQNGNADFVLNSEMRFAGANPEAQANNTTPADTPLPSPTAGVPGSSAGGTTTASGASAIDTSTSKTEPSNPDSAASSKKKSNTGAIVGGVVGGLVVLAILGALLFFLLRRRQQARVAPSAEFTKYIQQPALARVTTRPDEGDPNKSSPNLGRPSPSSHSHITNLPQPDMEELPAFAPGHYAGPVFEKGGYVTTPNVSPYALPINHGSSSH